MLGGFMGDFVRGAIDTRLPAGVRQGIALHRAIDVYTDAHPSVVAARAAFAPPFRRYAGILIDIWFDHLLARDFGRWSAMPLATFSDQALDLLERNRARLPGDLQRFTRYLRRHDLPAAYRDREMIATVLAGVGTRLTRANPLAAGLAEIARIEAQLERAFNEFFPQLVERASDLRDSLPGRPGAR